MATAVNVNATGNAEIDGLLGGTKWTGTITYSFPDAPGDYVSPYSNKAEPTSAGFTKAPTQMQAAVTYGVGLINSYTNANIQLSSTDAADIMIAQSPKANPTSYAYYPSSFATGGDIWFGTSYDYSQAALGNYFFATALHELGHAVGLKHSQETGGVANVAVPAAHDNSEYSIMSYRSYMNAPLNGYTAEAYGYPQTYMANDILALQTLYGANYNTQSGNTVYTWSPTTGQTFINGVAQPQPGGGTGGSAANRIFETIWDGNGIDTYDLSNYTTNLTLNLNPGAASYFSAAQIAYLGDNHYASGNVYNAYLFNNDPRSYIDNAIGGTGNDTIYGNAIANALSGGGGDDIMTGGGGNDAINGGDGTDKVVFSGVKANYSFSFNSATQTFTVVDKRSGAPDGTDTVTGVEYFQFADGTLTASAIYSQLVPVDIETAGATKLVQNNGFYYFNPVAGGTGPQLKVGGTPVSVGANGTLTPTGVEVVGGGYAVAWFDTATNRYTIWLTDSSGNYLSTPVNAVIGANATLESYETSLQQDLNNDGVIGNALSTLESSGSTTLLKTGNNFYLGTNGPLLKVGGAVFTPSTYPGWLPVGVETIASGFQVAMKNGSQFSIWYTDANGNFVSNQTGVIAGNSSTLINFETSFNQDLNSDGAIGYPSVTVESAGSTSLVTSNGNYFLGAGGPTLKVGGAAVTSSTYPGWLPVGVEAIAGGFEVAMKNGTQFSIWYTDSNGNFTSNQTGIVAGSSATLIGFETSFHQDLNGDGTTGFPASTTIESSGSTSLVQSGANYYFGSPAGPVLKVGGVAVTAATYPGWLPVGVEAIATGFEVAMKNGSQFSIWYTDSSGNFTSNQTGIVAGNSATLMGFESSFQQDLNGDGVVSSASATTIESSGVTSLVQAGANFFFGSPAGPMLKVGGVGVTSATYPGWLPVAVEPNATGYQVAMKNGSQFSIWYTDSNGNFTSNQTGVVAGSSATLQSFETSFQQDLNSDGFVGAHASPAAAGQDAFVFKADADPVWHNLPSELQALQTFLSGTELSATIHEALQPLHDLFALVGGELHSHDAPALPDALSDLLSGHFLIR